MASHSGARANPGLPSRSAQASRSAQGSPALPSVVKPKDARLFPRVLLGARPSSSKDGFPAVLFSSSEVQLGIDRLRFALVAKFAGGRPQVKEVRRRLVSSWSLEGGTTFGSLDPRHILIILQSEEDVSRALSCPIRHFGLLQFRLFRWSAGFSTRREPPARATWVNLPGWPLDLFDEGFIEVLVGQVGTFIAVDEATRVFSRPSAARACVEVDVRGPLPDKVWVGRGDGRGFWQRILFEDKLLYCSKCFVHGHALPACQKNRRRAPVSRGVAGSEAPLVISSALPQSSPPPALVPAVSSVPLLSADGSPAGKLRVRQPSLSSCRIKSRIRVPPVQRSTVPSAAVQVSPSQSFAPSLAGPPRQKSYLEVCTASLDRAGPSVLNAGAVAFSPARLLPFGPYEFPPAAVEASAAAAGEVSASPLFRLRVHL